MNNRQIIDFLNWMNSENFQPSSDDNDIWVHVGSDNAEEYNVSELFEKYNDDKRDITFEKQIPVRQFCDQCGNVCATSFWVPNEMWLEAVPKHHWTSRLCFTCFAKRADEKLLEWDSVIEFFPCSMATQVKIINESKTQENPRR